MRMKVDLSSFIKALPKIKKEIGEQITKLIQDQIEEGFPPHGVSTGALPLKLDKRGRSSRRDGSTGTPLHHTGNLLKESIDHVETPEAIFIGSDFIGARLLHEGSNPPRTSDNGPGLARRQFLRPNAAMNKIIEDVFKKHAK